MTCGDRYEHLLVTEDGKTPDDPWDWYAGPMDYDEWYDVVHAVAREVSRRWHWILAIEDKLHQLDDPKPAEPYPQRDQVVFLLEDFQGKLGQLGHVLLEPIRNPELTWEPAIRRAISAARDGTCVLETLDDVAAYYQRPPLPPGKTPKSAKGDATRTEGGLGRVLVTGALALGGGVLLWRRRNKTKEQRA